jgi:pimeloyl-ACP methyl ester carboxylesterase
MRLLLYNTGVQRFLPLIVHRAFLNNFVTFEEAAILLNPGDGIARGMYMTVTCSEGVPFITEQDILRETRGTFLGDSRLRSHIAACSAWPRGEVGANFIELVKSDVPVLMISGEADGATLPSFGEAALKYLPHGRQVRIQEYGHQSNGPCVAQMFREFIEKGTAKGIDVSCAATIRRPAFATEVPKQFDILSGPADPGHN